MSRRTGPGCPPGSTTSPATIRTYHKVYLDEATGGIVNLQVHPGPESMEKMLQLFMAQIDE
jgi:hypothetical protein